MSNHQCVRGQKQRGEVCCWTVQCKAEGFIPCNAQNGTDVCTPCSEGKYIADTYQTEWFEQSQCVDIPTCLPEQIRNEKGICVCDRTKGYIKQSGGDGNICVQTFVECNKPGEELHESGYCGNCYKGFYKSESSNNLCRRKINITCPAGKTVKEGDRFTDRSCVPNPLTKPVFTTEKTRTTTISNSTTDGEFPIGVVVGSIFGVGVFILLIVIMIYLIKRRRKKRPKKRKKENVENGETELLKSGIEHEEHKDTMDTLKEETMSYNSGLKENNKKATAVPIDEEETFEKQPPRNTEEQNIPTNDTACIGEEETFGNQPPRISEEQNIPFVDEEESQRGARGSVADEEQNHHRLVATVAAQVHDQPRQPSLPLLNEQPYNDDYGRIVNGPNSFSLQMQNGHMNRVVNNGVPQGVLFVDSLPSDPYDPIRPSNSSTSS
ncbi:uncharacterized protein LOC143056920 [Mytilus galloprovincialis]|uniref:uncharacterized protein LOC143056920 n=1 Tax=Mytilus galloprovincialis TaxID=29158 RepID=UPI003F7BA2CB